MDNNISGIEFEKICQVLVEKMGFNAEITKASGDGGIDIIAYNHQPLLSGKYIIQCKRYSGSVGEPIIRDLYGVVTSERANKGILITTGSFTKQAIAFAEGKPIELINGDMLNDLMSTYSLDVKLNENTNIRNTGKTQHIKCQWDFVPFEKKEEYLQLNSVLEWEPENLEKVGKTIELLQDYLFNYLKWNWEHNYTDEQVYNNKFEAAKKVILVAEGIKSNVFLYPEYLSILAQNYFLLGYWQIAIEIYEKMLRLPGVLLDVKYSRNDYRGELELASQIIHNICVIYVCMNETNKAKDLKKQHKYIFDLELQRTLRLIKNNLHLRENFENDWEKLDDVFEKKYFYFDGTLCSGMGGGLLAAINSDCERNGEPCNVRLLMDEIQINKTNDFSIELIDTFIPIPQKILEITYSPYSSIELYYGD